MKGSSMWVWVSMPPGITNRPPASITSQPAGACKPAPMAVITPPWHSTSATTLVSALTTVPPRISTLFMWVLLDF
jgi:hypothetical protein